MRLKKLLAIITIALLLISCEDTYKSNKNYMYMFQGSTHVDNIGRRVYGGHYFTLDNQINDLKAFKECYVNYLEWSGIDENGEYKKAYYRDKKNIKINLVEERWGNVTINDVDLCN